MPSRGITLVHKASVNNRTLLSLRRQSTFSDVSILSQRDFYEEAERGLTETRTKRDSKDKIVGDPTVKSSGISSFSRYPRLNNIYYSQDFIPVGSTRRRYFVVPEARSHW